MKTIKYLTPRDESALAEVNDRLEAVQKQAQELLKRAEENPSDAKALRDELDNNIKPALAQLEAERDNKIREVEMKGLREQVSNLGEAIKHLRAPVDFDFGNGVPTDVADDSPYSRKSLGGKAASFFEDVRLANRGDQNARERMSKALEGKAMTEGSDANGGYLVTPEISSELITLREQAAVLRGLFSKINVTSDSLQIASVTGGLVAGWVAELATKPSADLTFGQITAGVFTGAGLGVVSNQLLSDARPSIDGLITSDLAKRLATLEEVAFLNGTGTGQPLGLLNTPGVGTVSLTSTDEQDLLDAIVEAIVDVQTDYQGNPSHIVMHPRTWARLITARESTSPSTYLIGAGSTAFGRRGNDPLPAGELFGLPVVLTKNVPTNLGAGTNESRVIVGNFSEALILDRQGVTVDESPHVYFTSNQTVFRAEMRVGFTAARYPKAFSVIGGAGLANG